MSKREQVEKALRESRRAQLVHGHDWDVADVLPVVLGLLDEAWDEGFVACQDEFLRTIDNPYQ